MNDRDAVRTSELCQNDSFNLPLLPVPCIFFLPPLTSPLSLCPSSLPHLASILLPFSLVLLFLPPIHLSLSLSRSVPPSPLLSTSCSAGISAEAPVRLSGDQDGGSDITAPSTDCQPSAVAMATSATACRAEAGDETPAGGGREEAGECVRILFFCCCFLSNVFHVSDVARACLCSPPSVVASKRTGTLGVHWYSRMTETSKGDCDTHMHITHTW